MSSSIASQGDSLNHSRIPARDPRPLSRPQQPITIHTEFPVCHVCPVDMPDAVPGGVASPCASGAPVAKEPSSEEVWRGVPQLKGPKGVVVGFSWKLLFSNVNRGRVFVVCFLVRLNLGCGSRGSFIISRSPFSYAICVQKCF